MKNLRPSVLAVSALLAVAAVPPTVSASDSVPTASAASKKKKCKNGYKKVMVSGKVKCVKQKKKK